MEDIFLDELDTFKPGRLAALADDKCDTPLARSVAISNYFQNLSLTIVQVIPDLLVKHISSKICAEEAHIKELYSLISDAICIIDSEGFLLFFQKYFQNIISVIDSLQLSQKYKSLVTYIVTELRKDLSLATHLDVKNMVVTFKKEVLKGFSEVAQMLNNELAVENEFLKSLKTKLCRYEWVCKLTLMQNDIDEYIRIGKERSLNCSERGNLAKLIGIDNLSDDNVECALKLLEYYGVVKYKEIGTPYHAIIVVMAANLSLSDIIQDNCWFDCSKFREVQFLCTDCFYVDTSMCYGKGEVKINNVAVVASKVIVVSDESGQREINVSGAEGISYKASICARDGSVPGAHGENGRNGEPGESGGNILICADEIENSEVLILRSEGGSGGSGEHGGNGQDGKAIPSKSDDLRLFGGHEKVTLINQLKVNICTSKFREYGECKYSSEYAYYVKSKHGVQVLYGRHWTNTFAFLYSRGVNGISADGGIAGRGGKGGCGGSAGHIHIFKKNGIELNHNHSICVFHHNGSNGSAGEPGKPGKKDIVKSRKDYLVVDGFWKRTLRYDGFIDARPYTGKDSSRLDRGWYYCEPSVATCFDPNIKDGYIEFFRGKQSLLCPTKYNEQAMDGKEQEQEQEMVHSTPSKPINRAEMQIAYQVFSNEHHQVQDISSSIQLLQEMQQNLKENLRELETAYVMHRFKELRRLGVPSQLNQVHVFDVDVQCVSRLLIKEIEGTENSPDFESVVEICEELTGKPLQDVNNFMQFKLITFIEDQIAEQWKKNGLPEKDKCDLIYQLMEIVFHSSFLIHIECNRSLQVQNILSLFDFAEELTAQFESDCDYFQSRMILMKQNILPRYKWAMLYEAHQKLLEYSSYTDKEYQRNSAAVYLKICTQTSIEGIVREFADCFPNQNEGSAPKISPLMNPLPNFATSFFSAVLPLSSETKSALEMLMIFINEANEKSYGAFHFPDILRAVEREYEAYRKTISDPDLMFIITYIQEKLDYLLLYRTQLEDIFCETVLSKNQKELFSYKGGFIFHNEKSYKIRDIDIPQKDHIVIKVESTRHHIIHINLPERRVTVDMKPVIFPETILISQLDIERLWIKIEETLIKRDSPQELQSFIHTLNVHQGECIHKLTELLRQAHSARDVQFDVFAFHPPSHWVERLILSSVHKQYDICDPCFVAKIENKIDGLSQCYDKSLYYSLYSQFLQETSQRGDTFKVDILEVLERMRLVFIDKNLSSLVTKQGLAQSVREDADDIFCDLMDLEIIDSIGAFLPFTTEHTITLYCNSRGFDALFLINVFFLQKSIRQLPGKELSFWNHKLGELQLRLTLQKLTCGNNDECDNLLVHVYQMQRHYGEKKVLNFLEVLCSETVDVPYDKLLRLLSKCSSKEWNFSVVIEFAYQKCAEHDLLQALESFDWELHQNKEQTVQDIVDSIMSQHQQLKATEHLSPVLDLIKEDIAKIKVKEKRKSQFHFVMVEEQFKEEINSLDIRNYSKCHIAQWSQKFKEIVSSKESWNNHYLIEAFAVIRRGITLFYETEKGTEGVVPRDTQMVASLLFLHNLSAQEGALNTKVLQQISTGEGKTMVLCMATIYKVLVGEKVDIVTSSSVLATRDAAEQKPLYDMFGITVSHCCHEEPSKRCRAYEADVVYGDVGSFQRDVLETYFYDCKIRTERKFNNVFVDEVDSMLVDKGQNMLYLPHALPDMNCLDQIYLEIWSLVNAKDVMGWEHEQEQLYFALRHKLLGAISPNAFTAISGVSKMQSQEIFEYLVKEGKINSDDHTLTTKCFTQFKDCIQTFIADKHMCNEALMIIQQHIEARPLIQRVPKTLHSFIKRSLRSWIHSAVCAKYFQPNKEYIIDIDHQESASDHHPKIIIMDNETGVEQESSEWGNGLHQFLQLKHNLRLSTESLKAVYMSNISFFNKYKNIMGVTGTLGSVEEHTLFKQLYGEILIVEVPTNKPSRMVIELPLCCRTKEEWEEAVYSDVKEKLRNDRVVLLICQDVERARHLEQYLKSEDRNIKQLLYISSHQEKLEEKGRFKPGQLIIATNLAGRGTDIKLMDEVKQKGGLHVCLSYLPPNVRVELQASGRCARSGDPGSCRMIFHDKQGDLTYAIQKRNLFEARRVSEIESDYFHSIKFQEKLFYKFTTLYNIIREKNNEPHHRAVLDYCLDCWAFFLDQYIIAIESIPKKSSNEAKREKDQILKAFHNEVEIVMEDLKECDIGKLSLTPCRLVQLGHALMTQEIGSASNNTNLELAVQLYRNATVPADPFALYYLAAAELKLSIKKGKVEGRAIKQVFYDIMPMFYYRIRQCQTQVVILQLANRYQDPTETGNTQYFQKQKQHEMEIYWQFISSMEDVIGRSLTPSMLDHIVWKEEGANILLRIIHKELSLKEPHIAKSYCHRLEHLLRSNESYFTYEAKIRDKVEFLRKRREKTVKVDDFVGVIPDKNEFWSLMKSNNLITRETRKTVLDDVDTEGVSKREELIGYWNPQINIDELKLEAWDCLDANSFDWIEGIEEHKMCIYSILKHGHILNEDGQLMNLNLARPLPILLPYSCVQYYKAIKDTLWHHTIYRFILDHLRGSAEIDVENDVSDSTDSNMPTTSESVVHILISLNRPANELFEGKAPQMHTLESKRNSGAAAVLEGYLGKNRPHVPNKALNGKFMEQLMDNNMIATQVSGCGLNCMINAMFQHAKQKYLISDFPEAKDVRSSLEQNHPDIDLSGILHWDDEIASEVLACVNDMCHYKIQRVFAFVASNDGPLLNERTSDERFPSGKCVALWQQGAHFAAVVHHHEFMESRYDVEREYSVECDKKVPMINTKQLEKLQKLKIVSKVKGKGIYCICKPIEEIESTLKTELPAERDSMMNFLTFKLEVDYKTLNHSPRVLFSDQEHMLYDELCKFAVIKKFKMKRTKKEIDERFSELKIDDPYWYKNAACLVTGTIPFYLDMEMLNHYLKEKKQDELTREKFEKLHEFMRERSTISHIVSCTKNKSLESAVNVINSGSVNFLTKAQILQVTNFVLLMLQLKSNACFITSTIYNIRSILLDLESPQVSLRRLPDLLEHSIQENGDVLRWFSVNQCDLIINLAEQQWSKKSFRTALSVIAIGVGQIATGAVLLVTSAGIASFLCNALISEGVSDMIFGIEAFYIEGHCNWSKYFDHKKLSIPITIASAGIGAYLARGTQASRYAYKAFGNASMTSAKSTAKQTGKSIGRVIAKEVGKKIVKKAAGAAVDAGISIACYKAVETMSDSIDNLSQCIIDSFDSITEDEDLKKEIRKFFASQDPENAEKYLHQIFTCVMQRNTFMQVWDDIEIKLRIGASVATQAHGNAWKHLQMVNKGIKGTRLMKYVSHAIRFAPLVSESIKIRLVLKRMDLLKEELMQELKKCENTKVEEQHLDMTTCDEMLKREFKEMKQYLSKNISQRGKMIVNTSLQIIGQELKNHANTWCKEVWTHKIKGHMDMRKLMEYEHKASEAESAENPSEFAKYEEKLKKLMSRTRNPEVFAILIERHNAELGPAFAIPALETIIQRPIELVNEKGEPLLNVQNQHVTGESLVVKFTPGIGTEPGHFHVGSESFSVDEFGNDCLIHAVMKGAGQTDYSTSDIRREIASACKNENHPCYDYIRRGIACNYVGLGLIGGRQRWWVVIYPFLKLFGTIVQKIPGLHKCNRLSKSGTTGLSQMALDICHIVSRSDIKKVFIHALTCIGEDIKRRCIDRLLALMPSVDEVREGISILGVGEEQRVFLEAYEGNQEYKKGVVEVNRIKENILSGKITESDRKRFEFYICSAPANLRLGNANINRAIKGGLDYCSGEQRSENLKKLFEGYSTKPKKDKDGKIMTSYYTNRKPKGRRKK